MSLVALPSDAPSRGARPLRLGASATLASLAAAAIVAYVLANSPNFVVESGPNASPFAGDFLQEWLGGYIVRAGDHSRFYDLEYAIRLQHDPRVVGFSWNRSEHLPIVYPPFYYLLLSPLSFLSVVTAGRLWVALMLGAFVVNVAWVTRADASAAGSLSGWLRRPSGAGAEFSLWYALAPWAVTAAVTFSPLLESLVSGQKGTVCLLILTGTFLLLDAGRPFAAGIVFGLIAFKPQYTPVIALAMLGNRQWRFVGGGATTGALLVGLSLSLGGDVCRQYFEFATGMAGYIYDSTYDLTKSHCLYGFFSLLLGLDRGPLVRLFTGGAALLVVGATALALRGGLRPGEPRFALQFSALVLATLLLSPHLFSYDLTMLLAPMLLTSVPAVRNSLSAGDRRLVGGMVVATYLAAGIGQEFARHSYFQVTTVVMCGFLGLLATIARRTGD